MSRLTITLLIVLLLSIGFNMALWYRDKAPEPSIESTETNATNVATPASNSVPRQSVITRTDLDVKPLKRLLQNGEFIELGRRLQDALRVLPNDLELLLMEAEFIAKTEPLSDAILNYYDLLDRPFADKSHALIRNRIDNLANQAINHLRDTHQWDLLAQFVEPLFQRLPQHRVYTLALAEAYGRQRNFSLMESVLASLDDTDPDALALRETLYANRQTRPSQSSPYFYDADQASDAVNDTNSADESIALVRSGDQFLVDLYVEQTPVRMLIDTGASMTAFSARTFDRLSDQYQSDFLGVFQVNTAGGLIDAPMVKFSTIKLGKFIFTNLTIVVIPTDPFDEAEGLLGMNVLRAFDFRIDQRTPALLLNEF